MRLLIIILCLTFYSNVRCYESEEPTEVFEDARSCSNDEFTYDEDHAYDDSMFFSKLEKTNANEVNTRSSLNCFGLGGTLANLMESFLKKEANGTDALKISFYARSRRQPERRLVQCGQNFTMKDIDFDIRRRTIFIVHGFMATGDMDWIIDMENALLAWDDLNIFVVDWSDGASTWNYLKAAVNAKTVGDQIATFVNQIIYHVRTTTKPSKWGPLHLIGHSLGAHICGSASHELKVRRSDWPVYRITGLDPAQPCFRNSHLSLRLDKSDAQFVDVIHTNGKLLRKLGLGLPYPLGHVDFYPNGGRVQPGCLVNMQSSVWNYLPSFIQEIHKTSCSHGRSQLYFTESLYTAIEKNCTFWGHEWDMSFDGIENLLLGECVVRRQYHKCIEMGINAEEYQHKGTFFALTASSAPFCNVSQQSIDEMIKNIELFESFVI